MNYLCVDQTWAKEIESIRNLHSDETDIPRSRLDRYRSCRSSTASFSVSLFTSQREDTTPLPLLIRERDFYVLEIGGRKMGRYSSELKTDERSAQKFQVSKWRLDSAIHDLIKDRNHEKRFENMTLLTFCVAESLRCDLLAQEIAYAVQDSLTMDIQEWVNWARNWSATSSQIRNRAAIPPHLVNHAAAIKTLCL